MVSWPMNRWIWNEELNSRLLHRISGRIVHENNNVIDFSVETVWAIAWFGVQNWTHQLFSRPSFCIASGNQSKSTTRHCTYRCIRFHRKQNDLWRRSDDRSPHFHVHVHRQPLVRKISSNELEKEENARNNFRCIVIHTRNNSQNRRTIKIISELNMFSCSTICART